MLNVFICFAIKLFLLHSTICSKEIISNIVSNKEICISIKSTKEEYLIGEPVVLTISLKNISDRKVEVEGALKDFNGNISIVINGEGQNKIYSTCLSGSTFDRKEAYGVILSPGETILDDIMIHLDCNGELYFTEPMSYTIKAFYYGIPYNVKNKLFSDPLVIKFNEPQKKDDINARTLFESKYIKNYILKYQMTQNIFPDYSDTSDIIIVKNRKKVDRVIAFRDSTRLMFNRIIKEYPKSYLAQYATFFYLTSSGVEKNTDELYDFILRNNNFIYNHRIACNIIKYGDKKKLTKVKNGEIFDKYIYKQNTKLAKELINNNK
jgi:hypothetical protein